MDDIKVAVSPVGFRKVMKEHHACVAALDPLDYDAMTMRVSFKTLEEEMSQAPAQPETPAPKPAPKAEPPKPAPAAYLPKSNFDDETGETVVYFETNKNVIKDSARRTLNVLVDFIATNPEYNILLVTGHTDSRGSDDSNIELGKKRAEAVQEYLVSKGVDPSLIETMSEGERTTIASNKDAQGQARNTRAHVQPRSEEGSVSDTQY